MVTKVRSIPIVFDWIGFGNAVQAHRLEMEMTQYQVGQLCELSAASISDIEAATHRNALMSTVLNIANVFDIDVRFYFILDDTRYKTTMKKKAK